MPKEGAGRRPRHQNAGQQRLGAIPDDQRRLAGQPGRHFAARIHRRGRGVQRLERTVGRHVLGGSVGEARFGAKPIGFARSSDVFRGSNADASTRDAVKGSTGAPAASQR